MYYLERKYCVETIEMSEKCKMAKDELTSQHSRVVSWYKAKNPNWYKEQEFNHKDCDSYFGQEGRRGICRLCDYTFGTCTKPQLRKSGKYFNSKLNY